jgi:DNA-binding CsgD family transcriptional regulator
MRNQSPGTETTASTKHKSPPRGIQPKHHAGKSRAAAQARRKIIANALLDGKTTQEAGLLAGLSPKTADSQVSQILRHPQTQDALLAAMAARGMDDDYLAKHHKMLFEATKVISAIVIAPGGSDLTDAGSMTKDYIEVPDYSAMARGLDLAYRLRGLYKDRTEVDLRQPVQIVIKKFCSRGQKDGIDGDTHRV